jgi:hypothetical protein
MIEFPLGYYREFQLPDWFDGPKDLEQLLWRLWRYTYPDLYEEPEPDRPAATLTAAEEEVMAFLGDPAEASPHRRHISMVWALALASLPTVRAWAPHDHGPDQVLAMIETFLAGRRVDIPPVESIFPDVVTPPQALHEALDVFRRALQALQPTHAREAVLDALADCFEGYAVFPGGAGRRDLFNWWLVEVVPAAWMERLPDKIYTFEWPWPPGQR